MRLLDVIYRLIVRKRQRKRCGNCCYLGYWQPDGGYKRQLCKKGLIYRLGRDGRDCPVWFGVPDSG